MVDTFCSISGGLDDALNNILELCNEQGVPFVFALGRRALGRACAKLVPVSVVGIFNYEGSEVSWQSFSSCTFVHGFVHCAYMEMVYRGRAKEMIFILTIYQMT